MAECRYCEIAEKKQNLLYEDEDVLAVLPEKQAAKGHVLVAAKNHHDNIQEIDDNELEHIFYTASFAAASLFDKLEAHGTNIIAKTGSIIKKGGHFHIDVIARKSEDGLNFLWSPKRLPEDEMKEIQSKIKDKCDMIGVKKKKEVINLDRKPEKLESSEEKASEAEAKPLSKEGKKYNKTEKKQEKEDSHEDKESYLVKQLRRMP
ncbi:HIT family protein [Candidatus Woesearchaeota archaeon]|nr:HIT family protein [Candidatus Woesearchaeota archaeon]